MCGRFTQKADKKKIEKEFTVKIETDKLFQTSYNIAPTQLVGAIRDLDGIREFTNLKWGLIPHWSRDDSFAAKLINARAETLAEKPSFRDAYRNRRCLIPASGFYEWEKTPGGKQPHYFYLKEKEVFGFGGLWEEWRDRETGELIETCTIITTTANEILEPIHERMPVILSQMDYENWLDERESNPEVLENFLKPFPAEKMSAHLVDRAVNIPSNNSATLIEKIK